MKRFYATVLLAALCLSLFSCKRAENDEGSADVEVPASAAEQNDYAVKVEDPAAPDFIAKDAPERQEQTTQQPGENAAQPVPEKESDPPAANAASESAAETDVSSAPDEPEKSAEGGTDQPAPLAAADGFPLLDSGDVTRDGDFLTMRFDGEYRVIRSPLTAQMLEFALGGGNPQLYSTYEANLNAAFSESYDMSGAELAKRAVGDPASRSIPLVLGHFTEDPADAVWLYKEGSFANCNFSLQAAYIERGFTIDKVLTPADGIKEGDTVRLMTRGGPYCDPTYGLAVRGKDGVFDLNGKTQSERTFILDLYYSDVNGGWNQWSVLESACESEIAGKSPKEREFAETLLEQFGLTAVK